MTFDEHYLARLRIGDHATMQHLDRHFRRLILLKLWGQVRREREETLADEIMAAALGGIQRGEAPICLPTYICAICADRVKKEAPKVQRQPGVTREQLRLILQKV
jgi:hypothetical protein